MWIWTGVVNVFRSLLEGVQAIASLPSRLLACHPIEYFKNLSNNTNPLSSHKWVNLLWGGGSFACYWADHFMRLSKNKEYKFETLDYVFIATMAGISTLSAIASKKVGLSIPSDTTESDAVTPSATTTSTKPAAPNTDEDVDLPPPVEPKKG